MTTAWAEIQSRSHDNKAKKANESGNAKKKRIACLLRIIEPEEEGTEWEENSERPPGTNINRCDQEQNARNQRANDGEAQENKGDHAGFRATGMPERVEA